MKTNFIQLVVLLMIFTSCNKQKSSEDFNKNIASIIESDDTEALKLFQ